MTCKAVLIDVSSRARSRHSSRDRPIGASWFDGETVTCRRHMMRFDVRTGLCPDAPSWSAQTYPVRIRHGVVEVGL